MVFGIFLILSNVFKKSRYEVSVFKNIHQFLKKRDEFINPNIFATGWRKDVRKVRYQDYNQGWALFSCIDKIERKKFPIYF